MKKTGFSVTFILKRRLTIHRPLRNIRVTGERVKRSCSCHGDLSFCIAASLLNVSANVSGEEHLHLNNCHDRTGPHSLPDILRAVTFRLTHERTHARNRSEGAPWEVIENVVRDFTLTEPPIGWADLCDLQNPFPLECSANVESLFTWPQYSDHTHRHGGRWEQIKVEVKCTW